MIERLLRKVLIAIHSNYAKGLYSLSIDTTVCIHIFVQIIWKYFYSTRSGRDQGTLYHIRNRLNRSNVPTEVKRDFNACEDFIETVISSHIVAAALTVFGMKSVSDSAESSILPEENYG